MQASTPTPSLANQPSKGRTARLCIQTNMISYFMQEDWYCILVHKMHLLWSGVSNTTSPVLVSKSVTNWIVHVSSTEVRIDALTSTLPRLVFKCSSDYVMIRQNQNLLKNNITYLPHKSPRCETQNDMDFLGGFLTMSSCTSCLISSSFKSNPSMVS